MELIGNLSSKSYIAKEVTESNIKCEYCGKPYKNIKIIVTTNGIEGKPKYFDEPDCDCLEKIKKEQEEQERKQAEIKRKKERTEKLFENSMITPFFREKTFENLKQTKEVQQCIEYVKSFNPKTSQSLKIITNNF